MQLKNILYVCYRRVNLLRLNIKSSQVKSVYFTHPWQGSLANY